MAGNLPNPYSPSLPGMDPQTSRIIRDLADRVNYLTTELERVRGMVGIESLGVNVAKRENPIEGIINIPSPGGNGFIRVSRDGVIKSYTNPASMIGVPRCIHIDTASIGNIGTGLDQLQSFALPAGTLARDSDWLRVHYAGTFGANNDTKRIQVEFDGQVVHNRPLFSINGLSFVYDINYVRISSTNIRASFQASWGFIDRDVTPTLAGNGSIFGQFNTAINTSNLNTTEVVLRLMGESGTATDSNVLHRKSIIELVKMS